MSGKEAHDLLLKYCGGEKGLAMINAMIHSIGIEETVKTFTSEYKKKNMELPKDFKEWMRQSFEYCNNQTNLSN